MITTTLDQIRDCKPCSDGWRRLVESLGNYFPGNQPFAVTRILETNGASDFLWVVCNLEPRLATAYTLHLAKGLGLNPKLRWQGLLDEAESCFREGKPFEYIRLSRDCDLDRNCGLDIAAHWACRTVETYFDLEDCDPAGLWSSLDDLFVSVGFLTSVTEDDAAAEKKRLQPILAILDDVEIVVESDILSLLD